MQRAYVRVQEILERKKCYLNRQGDVKKKYIGEFPKVENC